MNEHLAAQEQRDLAIAAFFKALTALVQLTMPLVALALEDANADRATRGPR